jgi:molybdopterin-guanine dinucleotide biosynthesis protein A
VTAVATPQGCLDAVVVLCGGASRRMGRDKAALELRGRTLLEHAVAAAEAAAPRVLLATGVQERYAELGREIVLDAAPDGGPLAGIEAALARVAADAPEGAWLGMLPCDVLGAAPEVLARCAARGAELGLDAVVLQTDAGLEPLFGAVHTRALPAVRAALARGDRRAIAFHPDARVGTLRPAELPPELAARAHGRNVNTPEEWARARAEAREPGQPGLPGSGGAR